MRKLLCVLCVLVLTLSGCVNGSSRPKSAFSDINALLEYYQDLEFDGSEDRSYNFIRNLAGLVDVVVDQETMFADWQMEEGETEGSIAYRKTISVFGYDSEVVVGIVEKRSSIGAIAITRSTGTQEMDYRFADDLCNGLYAKFGSAYQAYVEGEKMYDKEMKAFLTSGEQEQTFAVVWPKSSVKWSGMVKYNYSADETFVYICVM